VVEGSSEPVRNGRQTGGELPRARLPAHSSAKPLGRGEIVVLIQEIERMQARFARRNNTGWVQACDTLLGDCRKLLESGEGG
jgi:hypothetical protein